MFLLRYSSERGARLCAWDVHCMSPELADRYSICGEVGVGDLRKVVRQAGAPKTLAPITCRASCHVGGRHQMVNTHKRKTAYVEQRTTLSNSMPLYFISAPCRNAHPLEAAVDLKQLDCGYRCNDELIPRARSQRRLFNCTFSSRIVSLNFLLASHNAAGQAR